ncbi:MAG: ComF family protein, partial [Parvibaculaceae bacterium]
MGALSIAAPLRLLSVAAGRSVADLLLPPQCLVCGTATSEANALCGTCWGKLRFITDPCCDRRGVPFAYDPGPGVVSAAALADPPVWDRSRAAVRFDDHSKRLVHDLKYHDRHHVAVLVARLMAAAGRKLLAEADVIVPVPLYRTRLWLRRFNQSALLAARLSAAVGVPWRSDLLFRLRPTAAQVGLGYRERAVNVKGAFAVPEERRFELKDRAVLLVDDVLTSGATANACAGALRKAGAARVDVLC